MSKILETFQKPATYYGSGVIISVNLLNNDQNRTVSKACCDLD